MHCNLILVICCAPPLRFSGSFYPWLEFKAEQPAAQEQISHLQHLLKQGDAAIEKFLEPRHVIDLFLGFPAAKPALSKVSPRWFSADSPLYVCFFC